MPSLEGPLHIVGRLSCDELGVPIDTIGDDEVDDARPLGRTKTRRFIIAKYAAPKLTAAPTTAEEVVVHRAEEIGSVLQFRAGRIGANATGTGHAVVDLLKNGVSILSATIDITSGSVAYASTNGGIATPAYAAGDLLSVKVTGTVGTGSVPYGMWAEATLDENPS